MTAVTTIASVKQFQDLIKRGTITVIQISLGACGGCKTIAPTFSELAASNKSNAEFFKISGDDFEDFMEELEVTGYPNFRIYHNGDLLLNYVGSKPEQVTQKINEAIGATKAEK
uniref:Thioredoxin putative n=1 Tax=Albugo laibachii Nc14 TaxID=890382 RepID=F0WMM8_9STRA|nr:thioredoxin putative [Albugo laibachii Nc14]|eukprot:CCA22561.1 thioredoxin putative [Albugo laibachii Nc14]